ncbi:MAG: hypothetical protein ABIT37_20655 [Luteolibacter sp.]
MTILFVGVALTVAFFVGRLLFGIIFTNSEDFLDCVGFALTPDIFSLFRGQYFEDMGKSFRLTAFMVAVGGSGALTYWGLKSLIG